MRVQPQLHRSHWPTIRQSLGCRARPQLRLRSRALEVRVRLWQDHHCSQQQSATRISERVWRQAPQTRQPDRAAVWPIGRRGIVGRQQASCSDCPSQVRLWGRMDWRGLLVEAVEHQELRVFTHQQATLRSRTGSPQPGPQGLSRQRSETRTHMGPYGGAVLRVDTPRLPLLWDAAVMRDQEQGGCRGAIQWRR